MRRITPVLIVSPCLLLLAGRVHAATDPGYVQYTSTGFCVKSTEKCEADFAAPPSGKFIIIQSINCDVYSLGAVVTIDQAYIDTNPSSAPLNFLFTAQNTGATAQTSGLTDSNWIGSFNGAYKVPASSAYNVIVNVATGDPSNALLTCVVTGMKYLPS